MSVSLGFYLDAGLTQRANPAELTALVGGSQERQLYLGSPYANRVFRDSVAPGLDPIRIEIADDDPGGGQPAASCRLALTQAGLDSAVPGAALPVSGEMAGGVSGALVFWVRWTPAGTTTGSYADLSIQTTEVVEEIV